MSVSGAASRASRIAWAALVGLAGGVLVASVVEGISARGHDAGMDFWFYRDIAIRWLSDGTYYTAVQLSGMPYELTAMVDVLYPPTALVLFVPFVWLPAVLWWMAPLGVVGFVVWSYRPSRWAWGAVLLCAAWPRTFGAILFGNTDMWVAAGVAAGLRWGWPSVVLAVKPVFLPLAIVGIRKRSTWIAAAVLVVVSLPLAGEYATAMSNVRVDGFSYAAVSLPFALLPIAAWAGRRSYRWDVASRRMPPRAASEGTPRLGEDIPLQTTETG